MPASQSHAPQTIAPNETASRHVEPFWFPGRWVGGATLILGPILLLTGVLLRIQYDFFFPQQLAAFDAHPRLIVAAYGAFAAGTVLMWPAVATLARRIGASRPGWAVWGGTLAICGLFARTFHAGVDHLAFQIVSARGVEAATGIVGDTYGAYYILNALNPAILIGWVVLAIGAYRSGTLGPLRSIALGLMSALMLGVLKGSDWVSVLATAGLCFALVPLGVEVLRDGPVPARGTVIRNSLLVAGAAVVLFVVGQLG